jgi:hypothetical protein
MATRKIVPRSNSEGGLGTTLKRWATAFIDTLTLTNPLSVPSGGIGVGTLAAGIVKANGVNAFTTVTAPAGVVVGTTDDQTLTTKELTEPQLTGQAMLAESSGNEGKINYANDANRKAVGGRALEIIVKSRDDTNYIREIISNRQDCLKYNEIIVYP